MAGIQTTAYHHLIDSIVAERDPGSRRRLAEDLVRTLGGGMASDAEPASRDTTRASADAATLRVLAVHGIGDNHSDVAWQQVWTRAIVDGVRRFAPAATVAVEFAMYADTRLR